MIIHNNNALNLTLKEKVEETSQSYSSAELRKAVAGLDAQLAQLQNQIAEVDEDDAEESTLSGREDPPEVLADDTTVMKIKLLQGNLKDLVNTFSALYDASLKNAVASGCRLVAFYVVLKCSYVCRFSPRGSYILVII